MTLARTQTRPTGTDTADPPGPQVRDDMTVEVALAVMAGARTELLLVCDNDDQRTGLVTRTQLTTVRDSPAYTDRVQLRDLSDDRGRSPRRPL
ncbi:CBS domain-containing protein [Streptomyces sp. NPDC048717]|uniref:CBS domain-containing protein n=1 Tax=unclassified Streptomyces TaxID=2593676 RepID=UPI003441AAC8